MSRSTLVFSITSFFLNALRPTKVELADLARAEADPANYGRFQPICRGPMFALFVIGVAVLAALPAMVARLVRHSLHFRRGEA
jgi:hypothetical protein